ncbi:MAG: hypothetical protein AM324_008220 [Candidatus Thorarchaeota archaeon SMTZ1-83]|nr:MAG: hypothetical protein AM324_09555 [Candidatus Thorarchaeota archaeon SMTZ1-83]
MPNDEKLTINEFHEKIGKHTNGGVWAVLDKNKPSTRELEDALELAYTSRYHWKKVGTLTNDVRAVYMISRVFSHMKKGDSAVHYANEMLELAEKAEKEDPGNWKDFDMPFVYEAVAKAHAAAGNKDECKKYIKMSQDLIDRLTDEQDKQICQGELDRVPC